MGNIDNQRPWAVLPVKAIKNSNSRLTPILSPTDRQQLSLSMLEDVLDVLGNASDLGGVVIVTNCPIVKKYLSKLDVIHLEEGSRPELNSAVAKAVRFLGDMGIQRFFTIPGDVPLLNSSEINQLIECVRSNEGVTLVPSHDGAGTNSIASSIPIQFSPQFGTNSLSAHCRIAKDLGLSVEILPLSGLGFDIDWPDDLIQLASMDGDSNSHKVLNNIDLVQRRNRLRCLDNSDATRAESLI